MGEHSGRYEEFAKFLNQVGFDVLAPDLPGHGLTKTEGGQTILPTVGEMVEALDEHFEFWITKGPLASRGLGHTPWYLAGHSLGALTALAWIVRGKKNEAQTWEFARRAFISAPPLKLKLEVPAWKLGVAKVLAKWAPNLKMANGISADGLSRDAAVVEAYRDDPLVHPHASSKQFFSIRAAAEEIPKRARDIEIPIFLSVGGKRSGCGSGGG